MKKESSFSRITRKILTEYRGAIMTVVVVAIVCVFFLYAVNGASDKADDSSRATLQTAITRAAVQCYAIEGFYPPKIDYLVENYGLIIDEKKFFVTYSAFASNSFPDINIFRNAY